jgi:hypothetical protein
MSKPTLEQLIARIEQAGYLWGLDMKFVPSATIYKQDENGMHPVRSSRDERVDDKSVYDRLLLACQDAGIEKEVTDE